MSDKVSITCEDGCLTYEMEPIDAGLQRYFLRLDGRFADAITQISSHAIKSDA